MHIREFYDKKLNALNTDLLEMGKLVAEAVSQSVVALMEEDTEKAKAVKKGDELINALEIKLEDECTAIIATEAPVASDLRYIITTLKVISNLERMGDHAVHIAKIAGKVAKSSAIKPLPEYQQMGDIVREMIDGALRAFVDKDSQLALQIAKRDDEVDALHKTAVRQIFLLAKEQVEYSEQIFSLLLASRFLERLGDHVTNICEWIIYSNEARHVELNN